MKHLIAIAAASTALILGSLSLATHQPAQPAPPVNTECPITGEPVDPETATVTFQGSTIGFCCPGCDTKWEKWSDAQKVAFVAKAGGEPAQAAEPAELKGEIVALGAFLSGEPTAAGDAEAARKLMATRGPAAMLVRNDPRSGGRDQLYVLAVSGASHEHLAPMLGGSIGRETTLKGLIVEKAGLKALLVAPDGADKHHDDHGGKGHGKP